MADVLIVQFDVFRNPGQRKADIPFVVVMQSDAVFQTEAVLVAPLVSTTLAAASRVSPLCRVEGRNLTLTVSDMAAVPRTRLGERVATLAPNRDEIVSALDLLFLGF